MAEENIFDENIICSSCCTEAVSDALYDRQSINYVISNVLHLSSLLIFFVVRRLLMEPK